MNDENKVFYGNHKVTQEEKKIAINEIFTGVSHKYDLMNNLMSFGMHNLWKRKFIDLMRRCLVYKENEILLDVASGTGDIAIKFLKKNSKCRMILSDINKDMLLIAKERLIDENLFKSTYCIVNDAAKLPFSDNLFALYTVSFGIRNFSNIELALQEAFRVLKSYCYFLCMEFSPLEKNGVFSSLYDFYSNSIIPKIGEKIAHNKDAYQYLTDSIKTFPKKMNLKK